MDIISKIRDFVENECKKPTSKYGFGPFPHHFMPMVKRAMMLADELGGDKEVVELAAWLHDIGSIIDGRENHHITGAKIAEKKLREYDYPPDKIEHIKKCIRNHRGSKNFDRETLEEQIIAEADAMSNFDNISGIFEAAYCFENLSQDEAKEAVRNKLHRKWRQLHFDKSRELVRDKYEAAMLLLE